MIRQQEVRLEKKQGEYLTVVKATSGNVTEQLKTRVTTQAGKTV